MALTRFVATVPKAGLWQTGVAAVLCAGLLFPVDGMALAATLGSGAQRPVLTPEQKTLHALNRLTFGPRPGDVAAVNRAGLEAWFERQLHPERIDDAVLDARLAQFPAMRLSQTQLIERFPTPEMLRRYSSGDLLAPENETERAIYADASFSYEEKRAAKQAAKASSQEVPVALPVEGAAPVVRRTPDGGQAALSAGAIAAGGIGIPPMGGAQKDALLALPATQRFQQLVALSPETMASLQAALKGPEGERLTAGMTPEQAEDIAAMKGPERVVGAEALNVRLLRDVYTERQLQAVMADFWLNHFSVYLHKNGNEPYLLPAYERDAVLPNALGKFEDLLVATAESPAMLVYLDNWESVGPNSRAAQRAAAAQAKKGPNAPGGKAAAQGINENYARELMELHTLGVKGGYTQADVIEVAKCFTGWTIDRPAQGGEFLFNPNRHEPGPKVVLGHTIKVGGMNEGLQVLHILATSPATAHFVSLKLAERFVSDAPPPALVDRMSATFLKSGGDLKAVLTTMFHSPEFWSPEVYRAKVKTPLEFVVSALRATDAEVVRPLPLVQAMDRLGMPIYGMQTPNGYSWQADAWVSSNALLTRMNFALVLSSSHVPGTKLDWPALLHAGTGDDLGPDPATEARLELLLLGQPAAAQTRAATLAEADAPGIAQQAERSFQATPVRSAQPTESGDGAAMLPVRAGRGQAPNLAPNGQQTPLATMGGLLLGSPDFQRR